MDAVLQSLPLEVVLGSEAATEDLAADVARALLGRAEQSMVLLEGQLGAGKTAFARGLARGMGVAGTVNSPTFNYLNQYSGTEGDFLHYDLYRVAEPSDVEELGFVEIWHTARERPTLHAVEWWRRAGANLPVLAPTLRVELRYDADSDDTQRWIRIENVDVPHH